MIMCKCWMMVLRFDSEKWLHKFDLCSHCALSYQTSRAHGTKTSILARGWRAYYKMYFIRGFYPTRSNALRNSINHHHHQAKIPHQTIPQPIISITWRFPAHIIILNLCGCALWNMPYNNNPTIMQMHNPVYTLNGEKISSFLSHHRHNFVNQQTPIVHN